MVGLVELFQDNNYKHFWRRKVHDSVDCLPWNCLSKAIKWIDNHFRIMEHFSFFWNSVKICVKISDKMKLEDVQMVEMSRKTVEMRMMMNLIWRGRMESKCELEDTKKDELLVKLTKDEIDLHEGTRILSMTNDWNENEIDYSIGMKKKTENWKKSWLSEINK